MTATTRPGTALATVIEARRGWRNLGLLELWSYRELLYFFVWRDLKVRYKQTVFGALWALLQPLMLMAVFTLFLGRLSGIAPADVPYPLFALTGLVPWILFSQGLIGSSGSLVAAENLIQKVYFPRLLLPAAAIGVYLLDFIIAMAVLGLVLIAYGVDVSPSILWIVPLTLLALAASLAGGIWLSAVGAKYRDVRQVITLLVQLLFFASPVAYSVELVPAEWEAIYRLNPMTGVLEGFRWALLGVGTGPPVEAVITSTVVTVIVFVTGLAYFRRVERTFADVI